MIGPHIRGVVFAKLALMALLVSLAAPAFAVQPDEILADPALEARARQISRVIRCPVCAGETIDDSNAEIARDLRLFVRQRLVEGDEDDAVVDSVVARFGESVLFEPPRRGLNWILWLAGPIMLAMGVMIAAFAFRQNRGKTPPLDHSEEAEIQRIMSAASNGTSKTEPRDD